MSPIKRFYHWYEKKFTHAIGFLFITHILQIPHFVWSGDSYLQTGYISHIHPVIDFFMYGVDLIEIPALINVTILFAIQLKNRKKT